ncbi:putative nuclease HARBI1 [Penaeus vannamei]|uniref:Putative nuclease HARBI1 n=1 Tax=Penaeus vannamei TaxID=6689 RepID=A0A3R7Q1D6_PENVA|nr:putative nuclease HARBI1 [Penaeus vannamei]
MATGSFQLSVADCTDVAQPSVCKYLRIVAKAIADLAPEFISFPAPEQEQGTMNEFFNIARMPGVIGGTDGCRVPIPNPGGQHPELYRRRKGWMSVNLMAACDASLKFTDLVVGWPGRARDSRVFTSSALCDRLGSGVHRGFLLGDSGSARRSYLLTPSLTQLGKGKEAQCIP